VAIVKKRLALSASLCEILQLVNAIICERIPVLLIVPLTSYCSKEWRRFIMHRGFRSNPLRFRNRTILAFPPFTDRRSSWQKNNTNSSAVWM
jgi:hypothetical protein